jgi:hypothetical protein
MQGKRTHASLSGNRDEAGFCEYGDDGLAFKKCGEFIYRLTISLLKIILLFRD